MRARRFHARQSQQGPRAGKIVVSRCCDKGTAAEIRACHGAPLPEVDGSAGQAHAAAQQAQPRMAAGGSEEWVSGAALRGIPVCERHDRDRSGLPSDNIIQLFLDRPVVSRAVSTGSRGSREQIMCNLESCCLLHLATASRDSETQKFVLPCCVLFVIPFSAWNAPTNKARSNLEGSERVRTETAHACSRTGTGEGFAPSPHAPCAALPRCA